MKFFFILGIAPTPEGRIRITKSNGQFSYFPDLVSYIQVMKK